MQARVRHTEQLADLADVVMAVSRAIKLRTAADPAVLDLSTTEVTVLRFIDHHPGVSPSAVAAATGLQRSNLSRALRELEAKQLVRRSADPADNRQSLLQSTALAAENLAHIRAIWSGLLRDALEGAGDHDIASALELLGTLERGLM
ncbi:MarR family winged helix-turn-helix transcriptional regulator [Mycolicibacterium frederiksbergense]|jgi:DNA-binding MarR family transcriptional regulator|uniref:MarR family winged helix-turn-helix transcriptional regulator n=1 Tax=Mycolicibacterium frederiksbergense TaxID=117567 RepID=UPI00265C214E|nr:MarR family transcriptional regulator [Mycolicibacterium frederiksbergense]MDO0977231.1 MarR family transcriptional regulator [Mycolicibacterium frederiksbergense]